MMTEASIYAKTYTNDVSSEVISSLQGENGWEYLMEHNGIFLQMPKYSSVVTSTWRSGKDYPYVDGKHFFPSNDWSAVKKWTAYSDCVIDICGDISVSPKTIDGVEAIVKKDDVVLWSGDVQNQRSVDNLKNISVLKGQSIYFIVKANENMSGDKTEWVPKITCKMEMEKPAESAVDIGNAILSGGCTLYENKINGFGNGASFIIKNVDLFDGYKTLGINLRADNTGDSFEIRLNSKYGEKIADGIVCATHMASEYQYFEFNENVVGENDICFVSASGGGISEISEIKLLDREPFGATPGFATIEAENAAHGGLAEIHNLKNYDVPQTSGDSRDGNNYNRMQKAVQAASEKSYVDLSHTGDYVEFVAPQNANRVVLRYTIPRNTNGTLSLYVNDSDKKY